MKFFLSVLVLFSVAHLASTTTRHHEDITVQCRAMCLNKFRVYEAKKCASKNNPDCYMCWENCDMFINKHHVWGYLCEKELSALCFPGCQAACEFRTESSSLSKEPQQELRYFKAQLAESSCGSIEIEWRSSPRVTRPSSGVTRSTFHNLIMLYQVEMFDELLGDFQELYLTSANSYRWRLKKTSEEQRLIFRVRAFSSGGLVGVSNTVRVGERDVGRANRCPGKKESFKYPVSDEADDSSGSGLGSITDDEDLFHKMEVESYINEDDDDDITLSDNDDDNNKQPQLESGQVISPLLLNILLIASIFINVFVCLLVISYHICRRSSSQSPSSSQPMPIIVTTEPGPRRHSIALRTIAVGDDAIDVEEGRAGRHGNSNRSVMSRLSVSSMRAKKSGYEEIDIMYEDPDDDDVFTS